MNSYLVDIFLSACLWFGLIFLLVSVKRRQAQCNQAMNSTVFAMTVNQVAKKASMFWLPLFFMQLFLLWRFYAALVFFDSFGEGAAGLLVIMGVVGAVTLWLELLLISVKHTRYSEFQALEQLQQSRRRAPASTMGNQSSNQIFNQGLPQNGQGGRS